MALHICQVANRTADRRGEFVEVANDGYLPAPLTGLMLSDYTATQQNVHIYDFPAAKGGGPLHLQPGQSAFVFTGVGSNTRSDDGNFLLFAKRRASIWNDDGDVAYLRQSNGQIVDSMTVGHPKRHPNGH